jgi:hypothetical protein
MEQRFLFDRVNMFGAELAIIKGVQRAVVIFPDIADATVTIIDQAVKPAQTAADFPVVLPFVKHGFFHVYSVCCAPAFGSFVECQVLPNCLS